MATGQFSLSEEEHQKLEVLRKLFAPTKEDLRALDKSRLVSEKEFELKRGPNPA